MPPVADTESESGTGRRSTVVVLVFVLVLDLLAFTCILPLFPSLMDYYAATSPKDSFYGRLNDKLAWFRTLIGAPDSDRMNAVFFAGLLGSMFSLLQFVSSPVIGALSDVFGRRPLMIGVTCGSLCANLIWLYASTFPLFVMFRVVGGLCKASVSLATAIAADLFPQTQRGKGMAIVGICFSFGFLFGPLIGALFARHARGAVELHGSDTPSYSDFAAPAWFAVILTALELVTIVFALPETLPPEKRKSTLSQVTSQISDYVNVSALFSYRAARQTIADKDRSLMQRYGLVYFTFLFLYSGLEFTLSFFTHSRFQYDSIQQGRMYFFAGLIMIAVQGGYVRRISVDKQTACALCGMAAIVPAYVIIGLTHTQALFYVGLALYAFASACVVPCITTLVSNMASDSDKGVVLGVLRSQGSLARAFGPFTAAVVYWSLGATLCYLIGGCLLLIPFNALRKLHAQQSTKPHGA